MNRNKRGLSTVVTSLIIILLVLVAIGIIWVVVRGMITTSSGQIDIKSRCLEIDVRAISDVVSTQAVTIKREAGGGVIDGVKLAFSGGGSVECAALDSLETATCGASALSTDFAIGDTVTVGAYIKDSNLVNQFCPITTQFTLV